MTSEAEQIIALLPMKANSERIKDKNFRDFCGKPLVCWILDTLLKVKEIDKVVINTDARHILAEKGVAETDRIMIRDRKPEICGDHVSMNRILADDVASVDADIYLMTHTTNPLMSVDTICGALRAFQKARVTGQADSLFTVDKVQTRFYRSDGSAVNHDPDNLIRTQDIEPWFEENSNLYIFTQESFSETNARIGKQPMMYEGPRFESIDIDDQEDWNFAIIAARHLLEQRENGS
ncbi:MAG: acylneuraminate cytidylyltransferase family protein [Candidatus Polarisedimenticolaceae bacterium]|nr:acylneuraminate cytidylyltransferase family protein [Candidatus Polarisedimenticolaceae bacterium]